MYIIPYYSLIIRCNFETNDLRGVVHLAVLTYIVILAIKL